jgi:hypothetical protein
VQELFGYASQTKMRRKIKEMKHDQRRTLHRKKSNGWEYHIFGTLSLLARLIG